MESGLNIWSKGLPYGVAKVVILAGDYQRVTGTRLVCNQAPFLLLCTLVQLEVQDPVASAAAYRIFFGMDFVPHSTTELTARLGEEVVGLILRVINPYNMGLENEEDAALMFFDDLVEMNANEQTVAALIELAEIMKLVRMLTNFPDPDKSRFWAFTRHKPEFINWYYQELIRWLDRADERLIQLIQINYKHIEPTLFSSS